MASLGSDDGEAAAMHAAATQLQQHLHATRQAHAAGEAPLGPPLLLVTTVDIGDGQADRIEVRLGDVPLEVAAAFVAKHGLPPPVIPRLAMHLEENLLKVEEQRRAGLYHPVDADEGEGVEVFHRLYQQAITLRQRMEARRQHTKHSELQELASTKTSMSWISSEMMRDRSAGPFDNYGEMLYAESLESMARKRDRVERLRAAREEEEVAGVTFQPEVSHRAREQSWGAVQECGSVPVWKRLSKVKLTKAQERLEMLRREKEEAEVRECTFKPQISGRSERLMTERSQTLRSLNVSAHQQLYQDAIRRQQKLQDYQHWYPEEVTFQPKLTESAMSREFLRKSLQREGGGLGPDATGEQRHMALVNRLYASYEKLQTKLAEARDTLQNSVDPATGKRLFTPEVGRGPRFSRNAAHQPVSEYLYSLSHQQEERQRAAALEKERRRKEEAESSKAAHGSKQLVRALQHKRFKQIFEFLDADGLGSLNLVAVIGEGPEWLDDLDDEVRCDLEHAAKLLARRTLKHTDSSSSAASGSSSIFMPPPPSGAGVSTSDQPAGSAPPSPSGSRQAGAPPSPVLTLSQFCGLMEEALAARRGPRAYLAPSPTRKYVPVETHKPAINARSKMLASRVRPKDTPAYEVLYHDNTVLAQKLSDKRAEQEAAAARELTFAPKLLSKQLVKEGRVMKAVREGTWWSKASDTDSVLGELDSAASLQQLASCIMAAEQPAAAAKPNARSASSSPTKPRRAPAAAAAAAAPSAGPAASADVEAAAVEAAEAGDTVAAALEPGFASSEEQRQYYELEREVAAMQRMLEEATAAAEAGQQSQSDQAYLTEILGLAQEQVEALAPTMSALRSAGGSGSATPPVAAAAAAPATPGSDGSSPGGSPSVKAGSVATALAALAAASGGGSISGAGGVTPSRSSSFKVADEAAAAAARGGSSSVAHEPAAAAAAQGGSTRPSPAGRSYASAALSAASPGQLSGGTVSPEGPSSKAPPRNASSTTRSDASFINRLGKFEAAAQQQQQQQPGGAAGSSAGLISAGGSTRSSGGAALSFLEGPDLFELAAAGGAATQQQQHVGASELSALEELAAAMTGTLLGQEGH